MKNLKDLQQVTVLVPASRLADFHAMYARWLAEAETTRGSSPPPSKKADIPFAEATPDIVRQWWELLTPPARRVFAYLAEHPGVHFSGDELAEYCQIDSGSFGLAGTLSWPGKHAKNRFGLKYPFDWDEEAGKYSLSSDVAALIRQAASPD
jgi:hypothetical protein